MKIQFVRPYRAYNPGEVAGFDDRWAEALVARGFAVPAEPQLQHDTPPSQGADAGVDAPPADRMIRRPPRAR